MKGFLQFFDENKSLSCYQEYLQGPCKNGEQYILSDEKDNFKPICAPTNCDNNETRYNGTCFPVANCDKTDKSVVFNIFSKTSSCQNIDFISTRLNNLIGGVRQCPQGQRKDSR